MPIVEIIRMEMTKEFGTFGMLKIDGKCFCMTLEPPDLDNEEFVSSIPFGRYICKPYSSNKYPDVYQVIDVPDRNNILFHPGNVSNDTSGCIILGESIRKLGSIQRAVMNSGRTFDRFRAAVGKNEFELRILELFT